MLKKYIKKIQEKIPKNENETNKKKTENIVTFIVLLVIVIISINVIWKKDENMSGTDFSNIISTNQETVISENNNYINNDLEERLTQILSEVEGAGKVSVMISYSSTSEIVPLYNENKSETITEEDDGDGGKRTIKEETGQKEIIYKEQSSLKEPVTSKITMPEITGVIVVCDGANNQRVNASIVSAVEAVTGVSVHKIQVLSRKTK